MTFKNTKTILFASLIATIAIPFSLYNMADASPEQNTSDQAKLEKIQKIQNSIEYYDEKKRQSLDKDERIKIEKNKRMLGLVVDIETLDYQGLGTSAVAQAKLNALKTMIENEYDTVEATIVPSKDTSPTDVIFEDNLLPLAYATTQYNTYRTSLQFTQSCQTTVTGQIDGYVNQASHSSTIRMNSDYPSSLHCNYNYKDTTGVFTKIGVGGSCSLTLADNDGGAVFNCPNIGTNNDNLTYKTILITSNAYYDWGWLPFTALPGWTTIVYL